LEGRHFTDAKTSKIVQKLQDQNRFECAESVCAEKNPKFTKVQQSNPRFRRLTERSSIFEIGVRMCEVKGQCGTTCGTVPETA